MVKSDIIDYAFKTEVQKTIMDELKKHLMLILKFWILILLIQAFLLL